MSNSCNLKRDWENNSVDITSYGPYQPPMPDVIQYSELDTLPLVISSSTMSWVRLSSPFHTFVWNMLSTVYTGRALEPSVLLSLQFFMLLLFFISNHVNYKIQRLDSLNSLCRQSSQCHSEVSRAIKKKNC